jgi:hypothetical protein
MLENLVSLKVVLPVAMAPVEVNTDLLLSDLPL